MPAQERRGECLGFTQVWLVPRRFLPAQERRGECLGFTKVWLVPRRFLPAQERRRKCKTFDIQLLKALRGINEKQFRQ